MTASVCDFITVNVRRAEPGDWNFIRKSWRESYSSYLENQCNASAKHVNAEMARVFSAVCPTAEAVVSYDTTDPDTLTGFAVYAGHELQYVYVISDVRRFGVAREILSRLPIKSYAFWTPSLKSRIKPAERGWLFTPRYTLRAA